VQKSSYIIASASLLAVLCAGAADIYKPVGPDPKEPTIYELRWDNGTVGYVGVINILGGKWVGNDFDVSTLGATNVKCLKFYSTDEWPNNSWDDNRIGIFRLTSSGVPGGIIWGPEFVRGTGGGFRWCTFDVGWSLPKGILKFAAALEQTYGLPNCDPYCLDTSPTTGRAWTYYQGIWSPWGTYSNLMLRVVMQGDIGVEPTSLGRVKALYY